MDYDILHWPEDVHVHTLTFCSGIVAGVEHVRDALSVQNGAKGAPHECTKM